MKGGGGLTWLGWGLLGIGGMLMYAGMTGQSLTSEIAAVLNGKSPAAPAASSSGPPVGSGVGAIGEHAGRIADAAGGSFGIPLPVPTYGPQP